LESTRFEADFALNTGATLDPFNESPWRYLVALLREHHKLRPMPELVKEYEVKSARIRKVLEDANRDPNTCANLTSARIDLLEMIGDQESLEKVSKIDSFSYFTNFLYKQRALIFFSFGFLGDSICRWAGQ
jgi:hypothetical protein